MAKKKNSGLKGLIFILIILAIVGIIIIFEVTKDNFEVIVHAYNTKQPLSAVNITVKNKTVVSNDLGIARIPLKASVGDKLIITSQLQGSDAVKTDTLVIDKERYEVRHAAIDIVFKK